LKKNKTTTTLPKLPTEFGYHNQREKITPKIIYSKQIIKEESKPYMRRLSVEKQY